MNYIQHLNGIFKQFDKQENLRAYHISLYLALFRSWNEKLFPEIIFFYRSDMMKRSKITSPSKYHRAIRELHLWNFIVYGPSKNAIRGSSVIFVSPEHRNHDSALAGYAKDKKLSLKEKNRETQGGKIIEQAYPTKEQKDPITRHAEPIIVQEGAKKKHADPIVVQADPTIEYAHADTVHVGSLKEHPPIINTIKTSKTFKTPEEKEIIDFFRSQGWPEIQALKFCTYYDSIGWKKGTAPIIDWNSAAKNWMLNSGGRFAGSERATKFKDSLLLTKEKDYGKPL